MARDRKKLGEDPTWTRAQSEAMAKKKIVSPSRKESPRRKDGKFTRAAAADGETSEIDNKKVGGKRKSQNDEEDTKPQASKKRTTGDGTKKKGTEKLPALASIAAVARLVVIHEAQKGEMAIQNDDMQSQPVEETFFDQENPEAPSVQPRIDHNPTENTVVSADSKKDALTRPPFGRSPTVNLLASQDMIKLHQEMLREKTVDVSKPPVLVTQLASTQDSITDAQVRNLNLDLDAAAVSIPIVNLVEDEIFVGFAKIRDGWMRNEKPQEDRTAWRHILEPGKALYEVNVTSPPLEKRSNVPGIRQWMTTYHESRHVRKWFPNIDRNIVSHMLEIHANRTKGGSEFDIYPLKDFLPLSPWNNVMDGQSPLDKLCSFEVGPGKSDPPAPLLFRTHQTLVGRTRAWLGFVQEKKEKLDSTTLAHYTRMHVVLKEIVSCEEAPNEMLPTRKELNVLFKQGESFFVTATCGQVFQDHLLAFVQFKRLPKFTYINFLATRTGTYSKELFGSRVPFMSEGQIFRKCGLALMLLRSIQLLTCCSGDNPFLFIQVRNGSYLQSYLIQMGFVAMTEGLPTKPDGVRYVEGSEYQCLGISSVVSPIAIENIWSRKFYSVNEYLPNHTKESGTELPHFPDEDIMAIFPMQVSGDYIDQAASNLVYLGHPFFYHHKPNHLSEHVQLGRRQRQVILFGKNYNEFVADPGFWFQGQHIQLVNQWLFRDADHPVLKEFFIFPIEITTTFRSFHEFSVDLDVFSRTLHKFCTNNYTQLHKRFIFYIENMAGAHWILHVAINPFAALSGLLFPDEEPVFEHGFFTYNTSWYLGCERQLIFMLNAMSYYRDLAMHGLLEEAKPAEDWEQLWLIGGRGPFGFYLHPGTKVGDTFGPIMPTRFRDEADRILQQHDGYNCGLYCNLFIMDFVLTQWNRSYSVSDLAPYKKIGSQVTITIPDDYGLGTTFHQINGKQVNAQEIADFVRLEIICLMERLHALYYNAYSRADAFVPPQIGSLPSKYSTMATKSTLLLKAKEAFEKTELPTDKDVQEALKIGRETRDHLGTLQDYNFERAFFSSERTWEAAWSRTKLPDYCKKTSSNMGPTKMSRFNHILFETHKKKHEKYKEHKEKEQLLSAPAQGKQGESKPKAAVPMLGKQGESKAKTATVGKEKGPAPGKQGESKAKAATGGKETISAPGKQGDSKPKAATGGKEKGSAPGRQGESKPKAATVGKEKGKGDSKPKAAKVSKPNKIDALGPQKSLENESKTTKTSKAPKNKGSASSEAPKIKKVKKSSSSVLPDDSAAVEIPIANVNKGISNKSTPKNVQESSSTMKNAVPKTTVTPKKKSAIPKALPTANKSPEPAVNTPVSKTAVTPRSSNTKKKKKKKQKESEDTDEDIVVYASGSEGSEEGNKKKRRIIVDEDSDDDEVMQDDDSLVGHIDPTLAKPKPKDPLFSQPLELADGEKRSLIKPAFYQPFHKSPAKSRTAKKKEKVPLLKKGELVEKDWHKLANNNEIFPRWVPPPVVHGTMYKDLYEPASAADYDLEGVPDHQKTKLAARKMCSANMSREETVAGLNSVLSKIKDKESKEAYRRWWHQSGSLVEKEANLTYWKNDLYLRFKPSQTGKKQRLDGTLHGAYESCVITEEGGIQVLEVAPDWVAGTISDEAREIVHRVATDWNERHVNIEGRTETGYLTLVGNDDKKEEYVLFDDRQVSKVRYLPEKKIRTALDKEKILPERWRGVIRGVDGSPDEFVWLQIDWITETLSEEFIGFVKSTRDTGTDGYVRIPEGSVEDHKRQMLLRNAPDGAPKLKYQQRKGSIGDNDRTCVLKSVASALSFLGYERLAFYLCNDLGKGMKTDSGFDFFQRCTIPKNLTKQERREFQFIKLKKGVSTWDILQDSQNYVVCLVGLQSSDHKTDHAISISGKWIFDSNFEHALPLNRESLNLCCSSDCRKSVFIGITRACMLKGLVKDVNK